MVITDWNTDWWLHDAVQWQTAWRHGTTVTAVQQELQLDQICAWPVQALQSKPCHTRSLDLGTNQACVVRPLMLLCLDFCLFLWHQLKWSEKLSRMVKCPNWNLLITKYGCVRFLPVVTQCWQLLIICIVLQVLQMHFLTVCWNLIAYGSAFFTGCVRKVITTCIMVINCDYYLVCELILVLKFQNLLGHTILWWLILNDTTII